MKGTVLFLAVILPLSVALVRTHPRAMADTAEDSGTESEERGYSIDLLAQAWPWMAAEPARGSLTLTSGFLPDPVTVDVRAGGRHPATAIGAPEACVGLVKVDQPDVRLHFTAGSFPLRFFVVAETDSVLVINAPNGSWYCNDDFSGHNPLIEFDPPQTGQYDIWTGSYDYSNRGPGVLNITELDLTP